MPKTTRSGGIYQSPSLRDQVYEAIRLDMRKGEIQPGHRFVELDLAKKYGVSRTPVREALFQLARDGLVASTERGMVLPVDTHEDFADRLEAHLLIEPRVVRHAAFKATTEEISTLSKAHEKGKQAHASNRFNAFAEANYVFRSTMHGMCRNVPLARCANLLEDQFLVARNEFYKDPDNRAIALKFGEKQLQAIKKRDGDAAEKVTRDYFETLLKRFIHANPHTNESSALAETTTG